MKIKYNKNFKFVFLFLSLIVLSVTILNLKLSYEPELISSKDCQCLESKNDPYNIGLKFTSGRFKGLCLDACSSRPLSSKVSMVENNFYVRPLVLNNIYHDKKFWSLEVPIQDIESVDVVFLNFTWKINHVSLKFHFKKESRLVLRSQDEVLEDDLEKNPRLSQNVELKQKSILISPDPSIPSHQKFNLLDGLIGSYSMIFKAYSAEEFFNNSARFDHRVKYLKTKLDSDEAKNLLLETVNQASNKEFGNYHLLFDNCATTTIDLILNSKNLNPKAQLALWSWVDLLRGVPSNLDIGTKRTLKSWDLISGH